MGWRHNTTKNARYRPNAPRQTHSKFPHPSFPRKRESSGWKFCRMASGEAHPTCCPREIRGVIVLDSRFRGNDGWNAFALPNAWVPRLFKKVTSSISVGTGPLILSLSKDAGAGQRAQLKPPSGSPGRSGPGSGWPKSSRSSLECPITRPMWAGFSGVAASWFDKLTKKRL